MAEIWKSLVSSQVNSTQLNMAQKQLDSPLLEHHDMWHLSDDEDRKERHLPGEGLDISWIAAATKRQITDRFYEATTSEGRCTEPECEDSTLSRRKLLDHIVTHYIIYVTDCNYLTSRRDSAVKHLRICHGRGGSITQADTGSWRRLRQSNPNLPTSCPSLPMSTMQYRQASRCSEERRDIINPNPPAAVKRIKMTDSKKELVEKPKELPIVVVERKVELRRRLARLREDFQAVERLRNHIDLDMNSIDEQLASKSKRQKYGTCEPLNIIGLLTFQPRLIVLPKT